LESFTQDPAAPTFYDAILTFVGGNGTLIGGSPYGMATYSSTQTDGGAWGSITGTVTDQTDLVTYVTSERLNYPVQSPNGTSFIIVAGNDGTLAAIPPDSTVPSITSVPTISGTLNVGETLTAVAGTVTGIPTPTRVLQWQRSDNGTTGWADISGATGTTYLLAFNDEGKYIRVAQTEENILGTATANSASTGQIQPAAFSGLLDEYPNAAAAYSLRKLRNFYTGDAIIVRRASDNTTQSIGFLANGELDTASLESFCAGTDGFVTTWFDQSGNGNNVAQTTSSAQPKIVSAGSTILENGKAAVDFDGIDDKLGFASNLNIGGSPSIIGVLNSAASDVLWRGGGSDYWYFQTSQLLRYRNGDFDVSFTASDGLPIVSGSQKLVATYKNSNSAQLTIDGSDIATKTSGTGTDGLFNYIGSDVLNMDGVWQELIVYSSNQATNRSGIQTNINDFYNIY